MVRAGLEIRVDTSDLDRRLSALPKKIENACLRKALRSTSAKVAKRLKAGTPRGPTGEAVRRVKVQVRVRRGGAYATIKYKDRPALYMHLREYGGRGGHQPARPFFLDAVRGYDRDVTSDFSRALKDAVESAEAALAAVEA